MLLVTGVSPGACERPLRAWMPDDAYFGIEPGGKRRIVLAPLQPGETPAEYAVTAINAEGRFRVAIERIA